MYILLFCIQDQRFWILDCNKIQVKNISIGKNNSIYSQYEITSDDLKETLINKYNLNNYNKSFEKINIPISKQSQQEQEFRKFRENLLNKLSYDYSEMNNTVYDVVINKVYKVQDKVITNYYKKKTCNPNEKRETSSYIVCFARNRKYNNFQYKLGDNDFYWLFLPDKKGAYIIPEQVLFENELISNKNEDKPGKQISLYPYHKDLENIKTAWINKYLYFFDKDIDKIYSLFVPNGKHEIILNQIVNKIIIVDKSSKYITELTSNIFKNVLDNIKNEKYIK